MISPDVAEKYLDNKADRLLAQPVDEAEFYKCLGELRCGGWDNQASITLDCDGRLISGQERLEAIKKSGKMLQVTVYVETPAPKPKQTLQKRRDDEFSVLLRTLLDDEWAYSLFKGNHYLRKELEERCFLEAQEGIHYIKKSCCSRGVGTDRGLSLAAAAIAAGVRPYYADPSHLAHLYLSRYYTVVTGGKSAVKNVRPLPNENIAIIEALSFREYYISRKEKGMTTAGAKNCREIFEKAQDSISRYLDAAGLTTAANKRKGKHIFPVAFIDEVVDHYQEWKYQSNSSLEAGHKIIAKTMEERLKPRLKRHETSRGVWWWYHASKSEWEEIAELRITQIAIDELEIMMKGVGMVDFSSTTINEIVKWLKEFLQS